MPAEILTDPVPPWREPPRGGHPDPRLFDRPGLEQLQALLDGATALPPLSRLTGMRLVEAAPGTATFTMPLTGWLRSADGAIAMGPLTIPADAAMACAIMTRLPARTPFTTSELALRQVRPARPGGRLIARATVIEPGPPVGLAEVWLTDEAGSLIAHGTSSCVTLPAVPARVAPAGSAESDHPAPVLTGAGPDPWEREPPGATVDPELAGRRTGLELVTAQLQGTEPAGPLARLTGLAPVAAGRGHATFALPATRWLCAPPPGRVQGGAIAMLADAAISATILTAAPTATAFAPLELKLNFLRPLISDGRRASAHATLIHGGRRISVARAEVRDADGRPIAVATGSAITAAAESGRPAVS
jgi:uncharacterized protein (TIGR00369 family)